MSDFVVSGEQSLLWKTGRHEPPFVGIHATSVDYFLSQLTPDREQLSQFFENYEVIYFVKELLSAEIIRVFNIITEPSGLAKGWYVSANQYKPGMTIRNLQAAVRGKPHFGIVKTWESTDLNFCRALLHVEVNQRWVPNSPEGLLAYSYYSDYRDGKPGYILLEGGALYRIDRFEIKNAPDYAAHVIEKLPDDRYPEVYLRAVSLPEQPGA
jgi:hypothetical protein